MNKILPNFLRLFLLLGFLAGLSLTQFCCSGSVEFSDSDVTYLDDVDAAYDIGVNDAEAFDFEPSIVDGIIVAVPVAGPEPYDYGYNGFRCHELEDSDLIWCDSPMTHTQAVDVCHHYGMTLNTIDSEQEHQEVFDFMMWVSDRGTNPDMKFLWINSSNYEPGTRYWTMNGDTGLCVDDPDNSDCRAGMFFYEAPIEVSRTCEITGECDSDQYCVRNLSEDGAWYCSSQPHGPWAWMDKEDPLFLGQALCTPIPGEGDNE